MTFLVMLCHLLHMIPMPFSGMWHWCPHWFSHEHQRSYNTSEQSSQHENTMVWLIAPSVNHVVAMHMTKTTMPFNTTCHIHQLVYVHIWHLYIRIYTSYEPLKSTMWTGSLAHINFTLLAYAPEQICMPHWTCVHLYCYHSQYIDPHITAHISKTKQQSYHHICTDNKFVPQLPHIYHIC